MSLFISEKQFINYMETLMTNSSEVDGISLISLNITSLRPVTSVIFISKKFIFAAKYNDKNGYYSDGFFLEQKDINKYNYTEGALHNVLKIDTKLMASDKKKIELKMTFPKANMVKWHKNNLKTIKNYLFD